MLAPGPASRQIMPMTHLLCIGHGYVARHLSAALLARGWTVTGTSRSPSGAARITATGARAIVWPDGALPQATHVLVSVPPGDGGCPAVGAITGAPDWVGYLSATGVYGDQNGGWVTEDTPLTPERGTGERRVRAEAQWQASGHPLHIFRLAGIYGPGRSVFDRLQSGQAQRIIKPGQVFSRIHIDDIVQALLRSIDAPRPGGIWNLADDEPAPPQDLIVHAARLAGLPVPPAIPFENADLSPMARAFYSECKRVSNAKAKAELGLTLRYPTWREGLNAVWAAQREPPRPEG